MPRASALKKDTRLSSNGGRPATDTRIRIVAAAERLFAERGIDGVSLSEINRAAGQRNRSALQYHFGTKAGVIHAILDKHTPGIELRRHERLDVLEAEPSEEPPLRALAEALVFPVAEKLEDVDGGEAFLHVSAQLLGNRDHSLLSLHAERINSGASRLQRLTAGACPHLPEPAWHPRWLLLTGLLFHGISDYARSRSLESAPSEKNGSAKRRGLPLPPLEIMTSHLVDAVVSLLAAPISRETEARMRTLEPMRGTPAPSQEEPNGR